MSLLPSRNQRYPFDKDSQAARRCLSRRMSRRIRVEDGSSDAFANAVTTAFEPILRGRAWMPLGVSDDGGDDGEDGVANKAQRRDGTGRRLRVLANEFREGYVWSKPFLLNRCALFEPDGRGDTDDGKATGGTIFLALQFHDLTWPEIRSFPIAPEFADRDGDARVWAVDSESDGDGSWDDSKGSSQRSRSKGSVSASSSSSVRSECLPDEDRARFVPAPDERQSALEFLAATAIASRERERQGRGSDPAGSRVESPPSPPPPAAPSSSLSSPSSSPSSSLSSSSRLFSPSSDPTSSCSSSITSGSGGTSAIEHDQDLQPSRWGVKVSPRIGFGACPSAPVRLEEPRTGGRVNGGGREGTGTGYLLHHARPAKRRHLDVDVDVDVDEVDQAAVGVGRYVRRAEEADNG